MALVESPRVGDRQRLDDPADRLPWLGPQEQVEVVGHQAVAEEPERTALLGIGEGLEEGEVIVVIGEDGGAVVAPVVGVIDLAIVLNAGSPCHGAQSTGMPSGRQEK